ncbi:hypothetical protein FLL45_01410 [Aliikangiella marina]|uniref:Uncharacterized protein n=1 Tax=Aliikangiella marina TaxID=1712262 RepID=A0A545THD7_9GAMM|nr:hypothetical protein [Aliikangiella marina]TQV76644.1 hypothetical protein FLL45_01410 [Aliikangiella marina]
MTRKQLIHYFDEFIKASIRNGRKAERITVTKKQADIYMKPIIKRAVSEMQSKGYSRIAIDRRINQLNFDSYQGVKINIQ